MRAAGINFVWAFAVQTLMRAGFVVPIEINAQIMPEIFGAHGDDNAARVFGFHVNLGEKAFVFTRGMVAYKARWIKNGFWFVKCKNHPDYPIHQKHRLTEKK